MQLKGRNILMGSHPRRAKIIDKVTLCVTVRLKKKEARIPP